MAAYVYEDGTGWTPLTSNQLPASGVAAGTYGDATHVGRFTVDTHGIITAASSVAITGGGGGGGELDYVQITSNVIMSATADGNGGGTAVIDGNAVTYDGSTRVLVEFYCPRGFINPSFQAHSLYINLYDGVADLGRICQLASVTTSVSESAPLIGRRFLTPSAGAHTLHVRGWKDDAGDVAAVVCGAGGASALVPAYYRITPA